MLNALVLFAAIVGAPDPVRLEWSPERECSAVLVAPDIAITAAHCAITPLPVARLDGRTRTVLAITPSPRWVPGRRDHDVAIVRLSGALGTPAQLPARPQPLAFATQIRYRGFGGDHGGALVQGVVSSGTRQRVAFTTIGDAVHIGDSGSPVVTTRAPGVVVGLVSAAAATPDGGIATVFDADDLAFITAALPRSDHGSGWTMLALASAVLALGGVARRRQQPGPWRRMKR